MSIRWERMQRRSRSISEIQLREDLEYDQISLKEYIDPFTGEPVK